MKSLWPRKEIICNFTVHSIFEILREKAQKLMLSIQKHADQAFQKEGAVNSIYFPLQPK